MPESLQPRVQPIEGGGILYDAARLSKPVDALFAPSFWVDRQALSFVAGGRGGVAFIQPGEFELAAPSHGALKATAVDDHGGGADRGNCSNIEWALRHYRRGGFAARFSADRYFWQGEARTRSFSEWSLLGRLRQLSLPVPAPIAARYRREGLLYTADLITERLYGTRTLAETMLAGHIGESGWRLAGQTVARFHAAGVQHADLNANNLLLGEEETCYLLDFDRGRIRRRGVWEQRVLARLHRSLEKIKSANPAAEFGAAQWDAFLRGYRGTAEG